MDAVLTTATERRRTSRIAARLTAAGIGAFVVAVYLLSTPVSSALLMERLQIFPPIRSQELTAVAADPHTAIVILSAGRRSYAPEFGGETLDALSLERARYGALLAKRTGLPVLVSGGLGTPGHPALADLMASALESDYGVHVKWRETRSRNTAENAIYASQMLRRDHIDRVLLVTHAWHMRRAKRAFEREGLVVMAAPTGFIDTGDTPALDDFLPSAPALSATAYALHEIVGYLWYEVRDD
jgi:uncharacterized SAM-binding protein YcdF (DUF218 family)